VPDDLRPGLVDDLLFLFDEDQAHAHLVIKLGRDVCGHAQIMHGGLTGSIFDETFGALVYVMKQRQLMPSDLAVTANLSTNYRAVRC
jgi:acyl-coenzyme A thioesterase PaaI-like protein